MRAFIRVFFISIILIFCLSSCSSNKNDNLIHLDDCPPNCLDQDSIFDD